MTKNMNAPSIRGPLDHSVREQIVEAAFEHFGHYGYEKTTVAELAKSIGFSKSYIYKFFDSKQAIGEVICANRTIGSFTTLPPSPLGTNGRLLKGIQTA